MGTPPGQDGGVPCWRGVHYLVRPRPGRGGYPAGAGGYPGRTTEGVLTTQRAVCLLRSRRRTFLFVTKYSRIFCYLSIFFSCDEVALSLQLKSTLSKTYHRVELRSVPSCIPVTRDLRRTLQNSYRSKSNESFCKKYLKGKYLVSIV